MFPIETGLQYSNIPLFSNSNREIIDRKKSKHLNYQETRTRDGYKDTPDINYKCGVTNMKEIVKKAEMIKSHFNDDPIHSSSIKSSDMLFTIP